MNRLPFLAIGLCAAALVLAPPLRAQGFSTSASVSGDTTINDQPTLSIPVTRNDHGTHSEASGMGGQSIVIPGFTIGGNTTEAGLTLGYVQGFAAADPGSLHILASDRAVAYGPQSGFNLPPVANNDTVKTTLSAAAAFTDTLTVTSSTLAIGTGVMIPFDFGAEFLGNSGFGRPEFSFHPITVYATLDLPGYAHQNYVVPAPFNVWQVSATTDSNLALFKVMTGDLMVATHVGDTLDIAASFGVYADDFVNPLSYFRDDLAYADGRDTAGLWLGALPDGIGLTSASGHDYRLNPFATTVTPPPSGSSPVPEPATGLLLFAGLGAALRMVRRTNGRSPA